MTIHLRLDPENTQHTFEMARVLVARGHQVVLANSTTEENMASSYVQEACDLISWASDEAFYAAGAAR